MMVKCSIRKKKKEVYPLGFLEGVCYGLSRKQAAGLINVTLGM